MKEKKVYISVLKILACFLVITNHCWNREVNTVYDIFINWIRYYAVDIFMFISFFLSYKYFHNNSDNKICKRRMKIICYPLVSWTVIYYLFFNSNLKVFKYQNVTFSDLLWQMITGSSENVNPAMWFQFDLIILSVILFIIEKSRKQTYYILLLFSVAIFLQYSGCNFALWSSQRFEIKYSIGRVVEMLPYMCIGCLVSEYEIDRIKHGR